MINVSGGNETKYYYHFDGTGSVIALSNINGNVVERYSYDVFGEPNRVSNIGNPYLFTARAYDAESGNYYYRARYYKPSIGRFLQTDRIGYTDGLNMYSYCGNNPLNFTDPFGLCKGGGGGFGSNLWGGKYFGTGYGASATDYWAARGVASKTWYGKAGNYFMGGFSALWTPETYKETAFTLGTAGYGAIQTRLAANLASEGSEGLQTGIKVYRVWGDGAGSAGRSWTTVNPSTVTNFRNVAGLPSQNAGRFVSEGILEDVMGVTRRAALKLGSNSGGLPELVVPNPQTQISLIRVSGVNPPF